MFGLIVASLNLSSCTEVLCSETLLCCLWCFFLLIDLFYLIKDFLSVRLQIFHHVSNETNGEGQGLPMRSVLPPLAFAL